MGRFADQGVPSKDKSLRPRELNIKPEATIDVFSDGRPSVKNLQWRQARPADEAERAGVSDEWSRRCYVLEGILKINALEFFIGSSAAICCGYLKGDRDFT